MSNEHFDSQAREWDDPDKVRRAAEVAAAIRGTLQLRGDERLLEYGAGTGLTAQALADAVGPITLADTSSGMRQVAEEKISAGALPAGTRVWDLDLAGDPEPGAVPLPEERFDLIVTSMVLHHIRDLDPVLASFHELLAPGGHVAIADLDSEDGAFHAHLHDFDGHDGFDRHRLTADLEAAGFADVQVNDCTTIDKHGDQFAVFLAVARRA